METFLLPQINHHLICMACWWIVHMAKSPGQSFFTDSWWQFSTRSGRTWAQDALLKLYIKLSAWWPLKPMATKEEAGMLLTFHPWAPGSHSVMSRTWPATCVQTVFIYGSEYTLQLNTNLSSILVWKGNIFTSDYKDSETHSTPWIALN